MPQNPQNNNSRCTQTLDQFKMTRTEDLRWLKNTTDTGKKLKVETTLK